MNSAVLFDFDGTIADTMAMVIEIGRDIARRDGYDIPDEFQDCTVDDLRSYTKRELLDLVPFPKWKLVTYMKEARETMLKRADEITLYDGMDDVIQELSTTYTLGVLTSNSTAVAEKVLEQHQLLHHLDAVHGGIQLFGKAGKICKLADELDTTQAVYVGDTESDIKACQEDDTPIVSVTWGYDARDILEQHNPDYIVDDPEDIITTVNDVLPCD